MIRTHLNNIIKYDVKELTKSTLYEKGISSIMKFKIDDYIFNEELGVAKITNVSDLNEKITEYELCILRGKEYEIRKATSNFFRNTYTAKLENSSFLVEAYHNPIEAQGLINNNHNEVIYRTLLDFESHKAKTDDIRNRLKYFITDWDNWWKEAKKKIKQDSRIDKSQSSRQLFSISNDNRSLAEKSYFLFQKEKSVGNVEKALIYAIKAIENQQENETLSTHQLNEITNFFGSIIRSEKYDSNLKIFIYFKNIELNLGVQTGELLDLLDPERPLYEYESNLGKKIADVLYRKKNNMNEKEKFLLITGIAANKNIVDIVEKWSIEENKQDVYAKIFEYGFRENLPHKGNINNKFEVSSLTRRIICISKLIQKMYFDNENWDSFYKSFRYFLSWINEICNFGGSNFPLAEVIELVVDIQERRNEFIKQNEWQIFLDLTSQEYKNFWQYIINQKLTLEKIEKFINKVLMLLAENITEENFSLYISLVKEKAKNQLDFVETLFKTYPKLTSKPLREEFGKNLYEAVRNSSDIERLKLIPYLEFLGYFDDDQYTWKDQVDFLCEELYWQMLQTKQEDATVNKALIRFVHKFAKEQNDSLLRENNELRDKYQDELEKNERLQRKIEELNGLINELKIILERTKEESSFQSKKAILVDLVYLISEVEKYLVANYSSFEDLKAIVRKFLRLMQKYDIDSIGEIGQQVLFDPKIHKVLQVNLVEDGDLVNIEERGFTLQTPEGKAVILKPAIVKRTL